MKTTMKMGLVALAIILSLSSCFSTGPGPGTIVPTSGDWLTGDALVQQYYDYLKDEGYKSVKKLDSSTLYFKDDKDFFFHILVDKKDPQFLQVVFPNLEKIEDPDEDLARCFIAMDSANAGYKSAKLYLDDDYWVTGSCEAVLAHPDMYKEIFPRMLSSLRSIAGDFWDNF